MFGWWKRKAEEQPETSVKAPAKRSFTAAQVSRLTGSWTVTPKLLDEDVRNGLRKLRARSREQALNNDYVRRYMQLMRSNVVGPQGVALQARIVDPDGSPDDKASDAIEKAWSDWCKDADVTGRLNWRSCQNLFMDIAVRDGEVLIRLVDNWAHNRFGFAIEFLDPECLDVELNHDLKDGNRIIMGVEVDGWRRPVAYHLLDKKNGDQHIQGKRYTRVPADQILHCYLTESAWQTRGFPWVAVSLMRLNMLAGYEEAELVAARTASAKMGFFSKHPEVAAADIEGSHNKDADGNMVTDAEPGTFELLPDGYQFTPWDPNHPSTAFKDFVSANLRGIAAGLGVSYYSLANDLEGVNYSSGRLGAIEDREAYKTLQEWLISSLHEKVYQRWLTNALLRRQISVAGRPLKASRRDKYQAVSWQARRWSWADPQKEMKSIESATSLRIRSISDVIREQGRDPEDVWQEIAREQRRMEELKISPQQVMQSLTGENDEENSE